MISVLAANTGVIGPDASFLVQTTTLLTFIASSYLIMMKFETPIAVNHRLRKD
jgi:hypothetical protein